MSCRGGAGNHPSRQQKGRFSLAGHTHTHTQGLLRVFSQHHRQPAAIGLYSVKLSSTRNCVNRERLLLEYERTGELLVDLGSDQTSLHNPFNGGYYPVQLSFRQANQVMATDPHHFKSVVQKR